MTLPLDVTGTNGSTAGRERRRMLIVSTDYGPPWNEGEKNIARMLRSALINEGWRVTVASNHASDITAGPNHRGSVREIATTLRFWMQTADAARRQGVKVIHLLSSVSSALGLKCRVLRQRSRASLVLHVTGLARPVSGYRRFLRADRIVVGGSYLLPLFPGAINLPPLSPHLNRQRKLEAGRPVVAPAGRRILYLGALESARGIHTLVEALALVRRRPAGSAYSLTIAWNGHGSPKYRQQIEAAIARHELTGSVRWLGVVNDLGRLYRQHDVVVIPHASKERMGFPLRLLEALSYGRPVVVSDMGEMPIVAAGCGVVFPRRDPLGLATALESLLEDPALYRRCVRQAYETVARYEPAETMRSLLGVYEGLEGGPR